MPIRLEHLSLWQAALLYAAMATPVVLLALPALQGMDAARRWTSLALRLALLMVLVLLLAGAQGERRARDLAVVVLRDRSASAELASRAGTTTPDAFLETARAARPPQDRLGAVDFAAAAQVRMIPSARPAPSTTAIASAAAGTDPAAAIELGMALLPPDAMHRLVLMWDGNATGGDLDDALAAAAERGIPIDVVPLRFGLDREVWIDRFVAPAARREGEPFSLEIILRNAGSTAVTGVLRITREGQPVDMDEATPGIQGTRHVRLAPGATVERLTAPPADGGIHRFRAVFEPEGDVAAVRGDTLLANNAADAVTVVHGQGRVLYVDNVRDGDGSLLERALARQEIAVDRIDPSLFPAGIGELQQYDAVVLANVPLGAGGLTPRQDAMLARYVEDLGGGLVMIGGPDAFGAGGWIGSETAEILPVSPELPGRREMPAGALVLVIDHSGSMAQPARGGVSKLQVAAESAIAALRTLMPRDKVGVVGFTGQASWIVPLGLNTGSAATAEAIRSVGPGGGTNVYPGLEQAFEALAGLPAEEAAVRHVIVLTDGRSAGHDPLEIAARMKAEGISLSAVAIGNDADRPLLERLATLGGGSFHDVTDPRTLPQIFIKEARMLRRALVRERPFTPAVSDASSPLVSALGATPTLGGLVVTWLRHEPEVTTALVSDAGEPVLAHRQSGLGRVVAFTSDAHNRWGAAWAEASFYDRFWSETVRSVARAPVRDDVEAHVETISPQRARLVVERFDEEGRPAGGGQVWASAVGPSQQAASESLQLVQVAPGRYEAEFATPVSGAYALAVRIAGAADDGGTGWVPAAYVAQEGAELRALASDEEAVREVARRTGGRILSLDDAAMLFEREGLRPQVATLPLNELLILLSFAIFLADVAARRIAWSRDTVAWLGGLATGYVRSHTASVRPMGDDPGSIRALQEARRRAAELEATAKTTPRATTPAAAMSPVPRAPVRKPPAPSAAPDRSAPASPAMQHLAAAKRRARRKMDAERDDA